MARTFSRGLRFRRELKAFKKERSSRTNKIKGRATQRFSHLLIKKRFKDQVVWAEQRQNVCPPPDHNCQPGLRPPHLAVFVFSAFLFVSSVNQTFTIPPPPWHRASTTVTAAKRVSFNLVQKANKFQMTAKLMLCRKKKKKKRGRQEMCGRKDGLMKQNSSVHQGKEVTYFNSSFKLQSTFSFF